MFVAEISGARILLNVGCLSPPETNTDKPADAPPPASDGFEARRTSSRGGLFFCGIPFLSRPRHRPREGTSLVEDAFR
jgi:hypothetical protein